MSIRTAAAMACIALAACGTARGGAPPGSDLLLVSTGSGLQALAAGSGEVVTLYPEGVAGPGLGSIVTTTREGYDTVVTRWSPRGEVVARATVEGDVAARLVTEDTIALTDRAGAGETPYLPAPKAYTRVVVLGQGGSQREYRLRGNFEPEAFKVDRAELFMIEYIPALAPERYRVRRLRLGTGAIRPIGRLKLNAPGQMQGTGRTQEISPHGDELYTLYTQQADRGHEGQDLGDAPGHQVPAHAFVHLLNLAEGWAHCIDLPRVFATGDATASAIAVSPSGARVFVADRASGAIAALNPRRVRVVETARIDVGHHGGRTSAAASADRLYVGGDDEIVVVDAATLEIVDRWGMGDVVVDLQMIEDRLHVTMGRAIVVLDDNGREVGRTPATGVLTLEGIVPTG